MRIRNAVVLMWLAMATTGCFAYSLNPLVAPADAVFDPVLVGDWGIGDSTGFWSIRRGEENAYLVAQVEANGDSLSYIGHLTQIGGDRYLDMRPLGAGMGSKSVIGMGAIAAHWFVKVSVSGDTLYAASPDPRHVQEMFTKGLVDVDYELLLEESDDAYSHRPILLTSSTPELRRFIEQYSTDTEAWETAEYRRVP